MIERTEAVALKSQNWSETSRIVHAFSRHFGRMKFVARGARRPKSKFGASFEPGTVSQVVFYRSRHTDLHTASEAAIVWRPRAGRHQLESSYALAAGLEVALKATPAESPNLAFYRNLSAFVRDIDACPGPQCPALLLKFSLQSLKNLGYHPSLDRCVSCRAAIGQLRSGFSLELGGLVCHRCARQHRELAWLNPAQAAALAGWQDRESLPDLGQADASKLVRLMLTFLGRQLADRTRLHCLRLLG
jgi:DNA repair protein RecO (recombination protein O)